jgi:hypothetical protein
VTERVLSVRELNRALLARQLHAQGVESTYVKHEAVRLADFLSG